MKAKVIDNCAYNQGKLVPGEIVEIVPGMETDAEGIWNAPAGKLFLCKKQDGTFEYSLPRDLQLLPEESNDIDWSAFRREVAKTAMLGLLAGRRSSVIFDEELVHRSVQLADELIKQLKEEK